MYVNLSNVSSTAFSMCPPSFLTAFACTERGPDKAPDGRAPAAGCSATPRTPRVPCSEQPSRRMGRCEIPGEAPRSHGGRARGTCGPAPTTRCPGPASPAAPPGGHGSRSLCPRRHNRPQMLRALPCRGSGHSARHGMPTVHPLPAVLWLSSSAS